MNDEMAVFWLRLSLEAIQHTPEQLEEALLQAGAMAVTLEDAGNLPILEPLPGATPLWPRTRVTGLFDAQTDIEAVKETMRRNLDTDRLPECRMAKLENRDWVRAWMDGFHPMPFGKRLWVCPSSQSPPDPKAVNLLLNPGLAFGSGTHPTTALCLEWLDGAELTDTTVIDYGCGSGILAIAAAKLGARQVWAVDIDPQALQASEQNAAINEVNENIFLTTPEAMPIMAVDILLSNILAGILIGLASRFSQFVKTGGRVLLAGILDHQAREVQAAFKPWFNLCSQRRREEWVLLEAIRKG
jgi:ribosomal protein L11 methyltransferase